MNDFNHIIIAIDPGNIQSGYVVVEHNGETITRVIERGKVDNEKLYITLQCYEHYDLAIEMIESMGMPVGKDVFDNCVWIGRFLEFADHITIGGPYQYIYRNEEKMMLCGTMKAKDVNIRQALADRFAPGQPNKGKGTKKNPGFFYGFKDDIWQAFAVAVTYFDKYIKKVQ